LKKLVSDAAIILLVEDDPNDAIIARQALSKAGITHKIVHLRDGEEAIHYLGGEPPFNDRTKSPLPALVLLDLKMPKYSGFDVLTWLQSRPELAKVPVVVLTGSIYAEDRRRAHNLGAIGYEIKPVDSTELAAIANNIRLHLPAAQNQPPS
jgi:CheY-like chemotaxis protein